MKLSKREPKHMGEVMSDIAERYDKLTKTKMSIKIIVNSQELKDKLLKESEYIHDLEYIDSDKANTLMHIYMNPDMIEVNQKEDE